VGLLRLAAVGAVDDGKSTLIGRLLHDTQQLPDDQLAAIRRASRARSDGGLDLSLATDGLRAERERGITIDVAYRYAASGGRKLVIADCPGHFEYTQNMATGASTADAAVVLVDVSTGLRRQTRRHLAIAALFGISYFVVAVNKMDLVGWDRNRFRAVEEDIHDLLGRLGPVQVVAVPVSALQGANVVGRSREADWYRGPTVLEALEQAPAASWAGSRSGGARLPVQLVIQGEHGPAYAGMLAGGSLRPGDEVVVLPQGARSRVAWIETLAGERGEAHPPHSITVRLAHALEIGRGDVIADAADPPQVLERALVTLCWFAPTPLAAGAELGMKQATRLTGARVSAVESRLDLDRVELREADRLSPNGIGLARLALDRPAVADPYTRNRMTGAFVLVEPASGRTVAAGMFGRPAIAG
ncbi:MAG: sulfate adenylyltransferase subunit 1, partial [Candidatus Dormibacteria bacterium]